MKRKHVGAVRPAIGIAALVAVVLPIWPGVGTATAAPPPDPGLGRCAEIIPDFDTRVEGSSLAAELQCGFVDVPVDYADPAGPTTKVAFSRLPASSPATSRGVLFTHTGGPGGGSLTYPVELATRAIGDAVREYDTVSMDYRGVGASDPYLCAPNGTAGVADSSETSFAKAFLAQTAINRSLTQCQADFTRNLNSTSIARDVDKIRERLGVEQMAYYGVSYGTVIGMTYRALFDDRVSRMWLDSPVDPEMTWQRDVEYNHQLALDSSAELLTKLAAADDVYGFGDTPESVQDSILELVDTVIGRMREQNQAPGPVTRGEVISALSAGEAPFVANSLLQIRDGGIPSVIADYYGSYVESSDFVPARDEGQNPNSPSDVPAGEGDTYNPIYCGFFGGGRDVDLSWQELTTWRDSAETTPLVSLPEPQVPLCAGWPQPDTWPDWATAGNSSPLMLGGHTSDVSTPFPGAQNAARLLNAGLLTSHDGWHSGTVFTQCGSDRISEFLRGGAADDGECFADTEEGA